MKDLPSVQEQNFEEAKNILEKNGEITLYEPCDCGSRILHNNGGNYHQIVSFSIDEGRYFVKEDSTCELTPPPAEWEELDEKHFFTFLKDCVDWM